MDLRTFGRVYEKKYMELSPKEVARVRDTFHNWQEVDAENTYQNIPEFCYSATKEEVKENDFSLVPSRYIEFVDQDSGMDFDTEMKRIQKDFRELMQAEKKSQEELMKAFKTLGYEL